MLIGVCHASCQRLVALRVLLSLFCRHLVLLAVSRTAGLQPAAYMYSLLALQLMLMYAS